MDHERLADMVRRLRAVMIAAGVQHTTDAKLAAACLYWSICLQEEKNGGPPAKEGMRVHVNRFLEIAEQLPFELYRPS